MAKFLLILPLLTILSAIISPTTQTTVTNGTFCYEDPSCGPTSSEWPGICQTGKNQSPIDIKLQVVWKSAYEAMVAAANRPKIINFKGGYSAKYYYIQNNGHSIQVSFTPSLTSNGTLDGYGFDEPYTFAQAHFHWGHNISYGGSEHTIDGRHYPMEVHLVHYKTHYGSVPAAAAATTDPKALAVIAVFLEPLELFESNPAFLTISKNLPKNYQTAPVRVNEDLDLNHLLPPLGETFFRYMGSLTTPGCNEVVEWTIFPRPFKVSFLDYLKFHQVMDEEGKEKLGQNYRPVQPLGTRKIDSYVRSVFNGFA